MNKFRLSLFFILLFHLKGHITHAQPFDSAVVITNNTNFISVPNNSNFNFTDSITYEAWIKPCKVNGNNMIFTKFWCIGDQNAYYLNIRNGKLRWYWSLLNCDITTDNVYESNLPIIQVNVWQHIAIVHTSNGVTLYLNGQAIPATYVHGSPSILKLSSEPLRIGTYRSYSGSFGVGFNGLIDEFRLWNKALTATEVLTRYNTTLTGNEPNLILYFNMNNTGVGNGINVTNGASSTGAVMNGTTIGSATLPYFISGFPVPNLGNDTLLCSPHNYILDATSPNSTYEWHDGSTGPTFSVSQSDTHWVKLSTIQGCFNTDTAIIIAPIPLLVDLGNDTSLCTNDSLILNVFNSEASYLWQNNSIDSTITIITAGTYWVRVINLCDTVFDTIIVNYITTPTVSIGNDTILCIGDSINIDATNLNATYQWQDGSTNPTFNISMQGIYHVSVSISNCVGVDSIIITDENIPNFNFGNDTTICQGNSILLDASFPNSTYLWSTGSIDSNIYVNTGNTYWGTATNICGSFTDSIFLQVDTVLNVNIGSDTTICTGIPLLLNSNVTGNYYSWSNGDSTTQIQVLTPNTYSLSVTNSCGIFSDTVQVFYQSPPLINLGPDTSFCSFNNITLDASWGNSTYLWNTADTTPTLTVNSSGIYWIQVSNICGAFSDSIFLQVDTILNVNIGNDTTLCTGTNLILNSNVIGNSYNWNNGATNAQIQVLTTNIYALSVTNLCGTFSDTIQVNFESIPNINLGLDTIYCSSNTLTLDATWNNSTYLWNTSEITPTISVNSSGMYWVQVSNSCGIYLDTILITLENPISIYLGMDTILCTGDSIILATTTSTNVLWSNGSTDSLITIYQPGTYSVSVFNSCGVVTEEIYISGLNHPLIQYPLKDSIICVNTTYKVDVTITNSYDKIRWFDGDTLLSKEFNSPGSFWYITSNRCGSVTDSFNLLVREPPSVNLGNDTVICFGEMFTKSFQFSNHTYLWNNGSTDSLQVISKIGLYGVTIKSPEGCSSYDDLNVSSCEAQIFIPNAFTPGNGDDINNYFYIKGIGIRKYRIVIYDRWGLEVYQSNNIEQPWDGNMHGKNLASGVYSYKIWYNMGENSSSITKYGLITLIR